MIHQVTLDVLNTEEKRSELMRNVNELDWISNSLTLIFKEIANIYREGGLKKRRLWSDEVDCFVSVLRIAQSRNWEFQPNFFWLKIIFRDCSYLILNITFQLESI